MMPALIAAVAVAGCGGSKELSRSELIAKADPICRHANEALKSSKITPRNLTSVAPPLSVAYEKASSELAKLSPPPSMAADWKVIVDGYRRASVGFQEIGVAAKTSSIAKPSKALIAGEKEQYGGQHVRSITALRDGFADCGKY
ncbi:MAG: hypothetical protein ACTHM1_00370 [Solirubrobacteraceae bacterium]